MAYFKKALTWLAWFPLILLGYFQKAPYFPESPSLPLADQFYYCAITAGLLLIAHLLVSLRINTIALGVYCFLLLQAVGFQLDVSWVSQLQLLLLESGMFAVIAITAMGRTLLSSQGCLDKELSRWDHTRTASLVIVLAATVAFMVSWQFRGNVLFSIYIPLPLLLYLQGMLQTAFDRNPLKVQLS
ncbi:hypothetical protein [Spongorhabdus nitratireducens]